MAKKDEAPPVPALTLDPPSAPVETLPGPSAAEPEPAPGEKPKRKRIRRTKAQLEAEKKKAEQDAAPEGVTPEDLARCEYALAATFEILSKVVAKRRGTHWALEAEEAGTLGKVWTTALAPYLPRIGAAVPWAAAAAVTWSMVQPRMARDAELAAETPPNGPVLA